MVPAGDDDMSLREIARTLSDFRNEFRNQISQLVRTDVYRAEQAADRARIAVLEKAAERDESDRAAERLRVESDRASDHRLVVGSIVGAALSFIGSLLLVALVH